MNDYDFERVDVDELRPGDLYRASSSTTRIILILATDGTGGRTVLWSDGVASGHIYGPSAFERIVL